MKNLVFAALALSATTVHAEVLPTDLCMAQSLPKITFSVMDEGAQERLTRLVEVDANDDGSINFASAYYLAQVTMPLRQSEFSYARRRWKARKAR